VEICRSYEKEKTFNRISLTRVAKLEALNKQIDSSPAEDLPAILKELDQAKEQYWSLKKDNQSGV